MKLWVVVAHAGHKVDHSIFRVRATGAASGPGSPDAIGTLLANHERERRRAAVLAGSVFIAINSREDSLHRSTAPCLGLRVWDAGFS